MTQLLWLMPEKVYSDNSRPMLMYLVKKARIAGGQIHWVSLHHGLPGLLKWRTKTKQELDADKVKIALAKLDKLIQMLAPKVIVVNDLAALWMICGKQYTLDQARGSVYYYKGVPCIPVQNIANLFTVNEARWVMTQDLKKIKR